MKINKEFLLSKIKNNKIEPGVFFLFGNDSGTIFKLSELIVSHFRKNLKTETIAVFDLKKQSVSNISNEISNKSLFSENKIIKITNINEKSLRDLEKIDFEENIVIVNGEGIRASSKLKVFFDNHKKYLSVPCYPLNRVDKIKVIDEFLKNESVILTKESYWYVIDNITDDFLLLFNELEKISLFKSEDLSISRLKGLIVKNESFKTDNIFFVCAEKNTNKILNETFFLISSQKEGYEILQNIKRFVQILSTAIQKKGLEDYESISNSCLPKYLFMKKNLFINIVKKNDRKNIIKIFNLIHKTEVLLRTNAAQYFEITQRFLLNLSKTLN